MDVLAGAVYSRSGRLISSNLKPYHKIDDKSFKRNSKKFYINAALNILNERPNEEDCSFTE